MDVAEVLATLPCAQNSSSNSEWARCGNTSVVSKLERCWGSSANGISKSDIVRASRNYTLAVLSYRELIYCSAYRVNIVRIEGARGRDGNQNRVEILGPNEKGDIPLGEHGAIVE